ncbi:MAG: PrsW family intramembrane metalloprotease [Peptococcaceae bacterium]|nr:PrsW family intramembrane metalloprotease [Peptococcaceae bacterium]
MDLRLVVIALTPAIAIGLAVYYTDRYDKEPAILLLKLYLLGAISVLPVIAVERALTYLNIFSGLLASAFTAFIVAGLTEEYFKRAIVLKTAYNSKHFNEKLDGIIYAVFASLGFATVENLMYVLGSYSFNPYVVLSRGIFSVPAHALLAVTMGYYLSLAKFAYNKNIENHYLKKALLIPVILHGCFDFILMANVPFLLSLFIPYVIYLWIINLKKLNQYYKDSKERYETPS